MKRVLVTSVSALLCLLMSCNDSGSAGSSSGSDQNAKNLENNRKVLKALETGDTAVINSLIADDAVDHQGPMGDVKGGDSVRHMLADLHNHVKDFKLDVIADAANGDYIFCLSHMTGTMNDASWGMPVGSKIDENGVDVVKVKDGKMVEHWGFVDPAAMMKHMQSQGNEPPHILGNPNEKPATDSTKK